MSRGFGRPFVLARNLDLAGCLAALDKRRKDEAQLETKLYREIVAKQQKLRALGLRCLLIDLLREARDDPPDYELRSVQRNPGGDGRGDGPKVNRP